MRPELSVVVVVHNMAREAPRTLLSLSSTYQRDISADDYEVIVVDNGSNIPLDRQSAADPPGPFRFIRIDPAPASPAHAINRGIAEAQGKTIGVIIDGARLVTPRLLHFARHGAQLYPRAIVTALGWYLGSDVQSHAMCAGYDAREEDALLESIGWPQEGYRLFEISTPDESSVNGWLAGPEGAGFVFESNALFASRETWDLLDGADERFSSPGGGLLNFDLFRRALELPEARLVLLLGEGTFHQLHGGIATNAAPSLFQERYGRWAAEYRSIHGQPWAPPTLRHLPTHLGTLPRAVSTRLARTVIDPIRRRPDTPAGPDFDLWSWPEPPARPSTNETIRGLVELMQEEFKAGHYDAVAAIARLARARAPREPEPLRLLRWVAAYHDERSLNPLGRHAHFHLALAKALTLCGEMEKAADELRVAQSYQDDTASSTR
jgi:hypothetical protein